MAPDTVRQMVASSSIIFAYVFAAMPSCRPLYPVASYIDTRSSILMSGSNLMWGMRSPLK